jgi:hypothetical protein
MSEFKIYDETTNTVLDTSLAFLTWRTYDGSGNNLIDPRQGKSEELLPRKSPADYDPVTDVAVRGPLNPSPRLISNEICQGTSVVSTKNLTDMVWLWGQFIDHEIDITETQGSGGETLNMSTADGGPLEPYPTPPRTINFTRSKFTDVAGVREQPNEISSYIDGTNVYGFNTERDYALRLLDGSGMMKTSLSDNGEVMLPYNTEGLANAPSTSPSFYLAGDIRSNENINLTAMHTVFVREHNRLCLQVAIDHQDFIGKDELIFQQAKRILTGMMQQITYNEFLPALLGSFPEDMGYDQYSDASIVTEFSTAGYRLGHTMLSEFLQVGTNPANTVDLKDGFFNPSYLQTNGANNLLIGASLKRQQEIDAIVVEAVRSFLFGPPTSTNLLDLAALNMQRGRDHGLPGYNAVRVAYGLDAIPTFNDLPMPAAIITKMTALYSPTNDPNDVPTNIDPWIGSICENHLDGKAVGPLSNAIIMDQFLRLRSGDRFWYTRDPALNDQEKAYIEQTKLSDILTRNTNYSFNSDVFHI